MKTHGCWQNILIPLVLILLSINLPVRGMNHPGASIAQWYPAQVEQSPEHFDLIILGDHLSEDDLRFGLKTNPGYGEQWEELGEERSEVSQGCRFLKYSDLSLAKYFGHDIRENYLPLRIDRPGVDTGGKVAPRTVDDGAEKDKVRVRAVYVVAAGGKASGWSWDQWQERILHDPGRVKSLSLASHVRPRPQSMHPGQSWTVHVEAPVRHLPPGVQEVKWLDILFR